MKQFLLLPLIAILFNPVHQANAGPTGYDCVVVNERHLAEDGTLETYARPLKLGTRFSVGRGTGVLVQKTASFWSSDGAEVKVLAKGDDRNSFVVTYTEFSNGGVYHTRLSINEYSVSNKKPFILSSASSVYSGTCD